MDEKIHYCGICAMRSEFKGKLPMRIGDFVAGYCRLCGIASPLVGYITAAEAEERGVQVPTLEELAAEN